MGFNCEEFQAILLNGFETWVITTIMLVALEGSQVAFLEG